MAAPGLSIAAPSVVGGERTDIDDGPLRVVQSGITPFFILLFDQP
jgi:hypothetical protein